jgi:hypothetical protein
MRIDEEKRQQGIVEIAPSREVVIETSRRRFKANAKQAIAYLVEMDFFPQKGCFLSLYHFLSLFFLLL